MLCKHSLAEIRLLSPLPCTALWAPYLIRPPKAAYTERIYFTRITCFQCRTSSMLARLIIKCWNLKDVFLLGVLGRAGCVSCHLLIVCLLCCCLCFLYPPWALCLASCSGYVSRVQLAVAVAPQWDGECLRLRNIYVLAVWRVLSQSNKAFIVLKR